MKRIAAFFVDNCRKVWLRWSVRFNTVGLLILSWIQFDPASVLYVWSLMPEDVRGVFPPGFLRIIGLTLMALGLLSVFVKQKKLQAADG